MLNYLLTYYYYHSVYLSYSHCHSQEGATSTSTVVQKASTENKEQVCKCRSIGVTTLAMSPSLLKLDCGHGKFGCPEFTLVPL